MTTTQSSSDIRSEIATLEAIEVMIATNAGTYGATEACRRVGTGDPAFATRKVYETVGGRTRTTGPDEDDAPGRMRVINRVELAELRKQVADLKRQLRHS